MKYSAIVCLLSATGFLFGCAAPLPTGNPVLPVAADVPPPDVNGEWEFDTTSAVAGNPPLRFAGAIMQSAISHSASTINGALHIDGSNCFDRLTAVSYSGSVTAENGSVTITGQDGQVVTFSGLFGNVGFTGTYSVHGGCADGDQGKVYGSVVSMIPGEWDGNFTGSAQNTFFVDVSFIPSNSPSPETGLLAIDGEVSADSPCLTAQHLKPAMFPAGSYVLGNSVRLEAETTNGGLLIFEGNLTKNGSELSGNYTVSDIGCTDSGTAVLDADPWGD